MGTPVKPTSEDPHSEHHVRLDERVFRGLGLLLAGAGIRISTNADGQYIISSTARGGGPQTTISSNWNYRGMYDPATTCPYMTFDVVQYGTGTSAGMYLSTIDNNNNTPDSGIGWVQVSTGTGTWL